MNTHRDWQPLHFFHWPDAQHPAHRGCFQAVAQTCYDNAIRERDARLRIATHSSDNLEPTSVVSYLAARLSTAGQKVRPPAGDSPGVHGNNSRGEERAHQAGQGADVEGLAQQHAVLDAALGEVERGGRREEEHARAGGERVGA